MRKASLLVCVAWTLSACAPSWVTQSNAPVFLRITGFAPQTVVSDVVGANGVERDTIELSLAVRSTNPNVTVPQVPMAVFMERYEIRYFRSDGRNTEGVDVPFRISGPMAGVIDAQTSGSTAFVIEVVRVQAKLEPPLRNLAGGTTTTNFGGGSIILTVFAEITVHGRTTAGQAVSDMARVQIDFANFGG